MVKIINYKRRNGKEGEFFVLEVSGGIQMIKSEKTGLYYATQKRATVPCTFTELMCKTLIGTELPGTIVKQKCEPYQYTVPESGDTISLDYRYVYSEQEVKMETIREEFAD